MDMSDPIPPEMASQLFAAMEAQFPNAAMQAEFETCLKTLLPNVGENDVPPKLITVRIDPKTGEFAYDFHVLIIEDFNDYDTREAALRQLGIMHAQRGHHTCLALFISEAWISMQAADKPRQYAQASDDPNRREAAIVAGMSIDKRMGMSASVFHRAKDGTIDEIEPARTNYDFERKGLLQSDLLTAFWHGYLTTMSKAAMKKKRTQPPKRAKRKSKGLH